MARTDQRGQHRPDDFSPHPGLSGVNLPTIPFHGTRQDQFDLMRAVVHHIGPCECIVHHDIFGSVCQGHPCAGHLFLCEMDEPGRTLEWTVPEVYGQTHFTSGTLSHCVSRLDRLMFARSQRGRWEAQEWASIVRVSPTIKLYGGETAVEKFKPTDKPLPGESRNVEDFPW